LVIYQETLHDARSTKYKMFKFVGLEIKPIKFTLFGSEIFEPLRPYLSPLWPINSS